MNRDFYLAAVHLADAVRHGYDTRLPLRQFDLARLGATGDEKSIADELAASCFNKPEYAAACQRFRVAPNWALHRELTET